MKEDRFSTHLTEGEEGNIWILDRLPGYEGWNCVRLERVVKGRNEARKWEEGKKER
jgi:hypothetical protein